MYCAKTLHNLTGYQSYSTIIGDKPTNISNLFNAMTGYKGMVANKERDDIELYTIVLLILSRATLCTAKNRYFERHDDVMSHSYRLLNVLSMKHLC